MCDQSHASYKNKVLRVAMYGMSPHVIAGKDGIGGADVTLLNYLTAKLAFTSKISFPKNWVSSINIVCYKTYFTDNYKKIGGFLKFSVQ